MKLDNIEATESVRPYPQPAGSFANDPGRALPRSVARTKRSAITANPPMSTKPAFACTIARAATSSSGGRGLVG